LLLEDLNCNLENDAFRLAGSSRFRQETVYKERREFK
jgi:hypothetical protein